MRRSPAPRRAAAVALLLLLLSAAAAVAQEDEGDEPQGPPPEDIPLDTVDLGFVEPWGRGPFEIRDPMPLSQLRLTLHPFSPRTAEMEHPEVRLDFAWANTYSAVRDRYTLDAETRRGSIAIRDGVEEGVDVGVEISYLWRGGGVMDGLIDGIHNAFGLPDGNRGDVPRDRYEVRVLDKDDGSIEADIDSEAGLGDVILSSKARLSDGEAEWPAAALLLEVRLPTAEGDLGASGIDAGLALSLSQRYFDDFVLSAGGGGTYFFDDTFEGLDFSSGRGYGFAALEWELVDFASLVVQADIATPLIDNVGPIDGVQSYAQFGVKVDLPDGAVLELAAIENIRDQDSTADFGVYAALGFRF